MRTIFPFLLLSLLLLTLLWSCSGKTKAEANQEEAEVRGAQLLDQARKALRAEDYEQARRLVMSLRTECPLALEARRRAILTLDSIELASSTDSVRYAEGEEWERLSMKQQFYQRKLREDIHSYGD